MSDEFGILLAGAGSMVASLACGNPPPIAAPAAPVAEHREAAKPESEPEVAPESEEPAEVQGPPARVAPMVWRASVLRTSSSTTAPGSVQSVWNVAVVSTQIPRVATVGDEVVVLPMRRELPAVATTITHVQFQPAMSDYPATWDIEVDVSDRAFLTAEPDPGNTGDAPFDAIVVYPTAAGARLHRAPISKEDLPAAEGASHRTLWAAVDFDSDGRADATIFRFCCNKPDEPETGAGTVGCLLDCEKTFTRQPGEAWRLADESQED